MLRHAKALVVKQICAQVNRIQLLRKQARLTQVELADKIGVSKSQFIRYESKNVQPPADTMNKLADALGTSKQSYQSSISSLATVDPLISYHLNGKTDVFERIENLIGQLPSQITTSKMSLDDINKLTHFLSENLHDKVYRDSVKEVKELTVKLSKKIGCCTKWKVKKLLSKTVILDEDYKETDELLSKYLTGIQQLTL